MTQRPKVEGSEKWKVKCKDVKRSEVKILSETYVSSLIYNYVISVQYVVSLLFASLFYFLITRLMFF